jgi:hypothetical protein
MCARLPTASGRASRIRKYRRSPGQHVTCWQTLSIEVLSFQDSGRSSAFLPRLRGPMWLHSVRAQPFGSRCSAAKFPSLPIVFHEGRRASAGALMARPEGHQQGGPVSRNAGYSHRRTACYLLSAAGRGHERGSGQNLLGQRTHNNPRCDTWAATPSRRKARKL